MTLKQEDNEGEREIRMITDGKNKDLRCNSLRSDGKVK